MFECVCTVCDVTLFIFVLAFLLFFFQFSVQPAPAGQPLAAHGDTLNSQTMLRKAAGISAASILGGSAYVFSDPGARRSLDFWSRLGPIVGSYVGTFLIHKYYHHSTTAERTMAFHHLHESHAPRVLKAIVDLRGIFIKAGQYLSVRPEITPEPYRRAFKRLQTDAPSEPIEIILQVIETELGRPVADMFSYVNPVPCGSASTAQAHVATLAGTDNEEVVIKVQYPNARAWFDSDISSLSTMARLINQMDDDVEQEELDPILEEFAKQFMAEFDYVAEQDSMMDIGNALRASKKYDDTVVVPTVLRDLCSDKVITMTYLPGPTLENRASVLLKRMGVDLRQGVGSFLADTEKKRKLKDGGGGGGGGGEDDGGVKLLAGESGGKGGDTDGSGSGGSKSTGRVGQLLLSMLGPDLALRLWSVVDGVVVRTKGALVFLLLDVLCLRTASSSSSSSTLQLTDGSGDNAAVQGVKTLETWTEWAERTRAEHEEMQSLSSIYNWVDVLLDVHGKEIFLPIIPNIISSFETPL